MSALQTTDRKASKIDCTSILKSPCSSELLQASKSIVPCSFWASKASKVAPQAVSVEIVQGVPMPIRQPFRSQRSAQKSLHGSRVGARATASIEARVVAELDPYTRKRDSTWRAVHFTAHMPSDCTQHASLTCKASGCHSSLSLASRRYGSSNDSLDLKRTAAWNLNASAGTETNIHSAPKKYEG